MSKKTGVEWTSRVAVAICCLGVFALAGCPWQSDMPPSPVSTMRPVRTQTVQTRSHEPAKRFTGTAESTSSFALAFYTAGQIHELRVTAGDRVNEGDIVALLDQQPILSELSQSRTSLARAEAEFRNAESLLERVTVLRAENKSSQSDVDTVRASLERARAARDSAASQVRLLEDQLALTEMIAPDRCTVVRLLASVRDQVRQGVPVVELNCGDTLQIRIDVPESNILSLQEGAEATVTFDALPDRPFRGRVREIGLAHRDVFTSFPVIIRLTEMPTGLRSGMSVTVDLELEEDQSLADLLLVPVKALMQEGGQMFVYLLRPHIAQDRGVVAKQTLKIGRVLGDWVEVIDGVASGDRVITAGLQSIYDGLEVKVFPDDGREN